MTPTHQHHRVVFDFANGTHRGFDSEILCAQYSTMCTKAALQYTDWIYSSDNLIEIRGQGKALFDIPADVNLSMMYKVGLVDQCPPSALTGLLCPDHRQ